MKTSLLSSITAAVLAALMIGGSAASAAPRKEAAPFARVYLAIRGCTSCSHCRTSIRQMVRSNGQGGEARIRDDQVEVRYATPRIVPLREVIRSLAENRLHDLSLVDVLFEARGAMATAKDGSATFTLPETGQTFPIALAPSVGRPPQGAPVRLTAVVDGWRKNGEISLVAREVHVGG